MEKCRFCRGGVFVATAQRLGSKQLKYMFTKLIGMVSGNGAATAFFYRLTSMIGPPDPLPPDSCPLIPDS